MTRFIVVCLVNGTLFGILDGILMGNPIARELSQVYAPIARTTFPIQAGIIVDILYGFILGGVFRLLYMSLPGHSAFAKGAGFASIVWFFRTFMNVISSWLMYAIPVSTLVYTAFAGFLELLVMGMVYSFLLKPAIHQNNDKSS